MRRRSNLRKRTCSHGFISTRRSICTRQIAVSNKCLPLCSRAVATGIAERQFADLGIDAEHPLARFLISSGEDTAAYLALDDTVIWGAVERFSAATDCYVSDMARRLCNRQLFKALDIETAFANMPSVGRAIRHIEREFAAEMGERSQGHRDDKYTRRYRCR